jgi:hypothetical protein
MSILVLADRYDYLMKRYEKADAIMSNMDVSIADKEKWLPEFREVVRELNEIFTR